MPLALTRLSLTQRGKLEVWESMVKLMLEPALCSAESFGPGGRCQLGQNKHVDLSGPENDKKRGHSMKDFAHSSNFSVLFYSHTSTKGAWFATFPSRWPEDRIFSNHGSQALGNKYMFQLLQVKVP